jgi:uncharacterized protein (TIGR02757 family)
MDRIMGASPAFNKDFFDNLYSTYNRQDFIHPDPLEFLHEYGCSLDREITGIIASSLAYGRVAQILCSVGRVLSRMGSSPRKFLESATRETLNTSFSGFRHRFTTGDELIEFLLAVRAVIIRHGSLHRCFLDRHRPEDPDTTSALQSFVRELRSHLSHSYNSLLPCPEKRSACKRLHLFLRWMVREDEVDPGGWTGVAPAKLVIPLDTHMHRIGLMMGMTGRKQADLRTALEITHAFQRIDPHDPVRYDFSLTRLGIRADTDMSVLRGYQTSKENMRGACNG